MSDFAAGAVLIGRGQQLATISKMEIVHDRRDGPYYVWNWLRDRPVAALFNNNRHRRRRFPTLSELGRGE
jgi:hypothetical protein